MYIQPVCDCSCMYMCKQHTVLKLTGEGLTSQLEHLKWKLELSMICMYVIG